MNQMTNIALQDDRILKIAVLAVGGQGGGVLSGWITQLAEQNGFHAQSTSVPGVAQRTGATIYYIEMKRINPAHPDKLPIFALMPAQQDVDIVMASEIVEVGRSILRDLVAPNRTVLIGSSHRDLTIFEKQVPGDGRKDPAQIHKAAAAMSAQFICFDMMKLAKDNGSVVSSALFGALAGAGALPFALDDYRAIIKRSGRGVDQSLATFEAAYLRATTPELIEADDAPVEATTVPELTGPAPLLKDFAALQAQVAALPEELREIATLGLHKVVDFQDIAYGREYLERAARCTAEDAKPYNWSREAYKYTANAMAYDDIIRVADIKTRASRADRVRREVAVAHDAVLNVTEYFHPRAEEMIGLMPAGMGAWFDARPKAQRRLDHLVNRGRRLRTDRAGTFTMLWCVAGLRRFRRRLFRHAQEQAHLDRWLALATAERIKDYDLGVEILKCRRLIKGYSDTHARGHSKFDRVLGGLELLRGRADAADWVRRLREAALQDEDGIALDGALETLRQM